MTEMVVEWALSVKTTGKQRSFSFAYNACDCSSFEISPVKDQHFYAATVYHPPNPTYCPDNLIEFLENVFESILSMDPNARRMIAGDINQLKLEPFLHSISTS